MGITARKLSMRGLRTFCAAAQHSTLKQAADELFITPSAVSHQLKKLEGELGLSLFERDGRSLKLTAAGAMLYEESREAMMQLEVAAARVQATYSRPTLKISVQPFFASELLMPRLHLFKEEYPHVEVSIDASDDSTEVKPGAADLLIRLFRSAPKGFEAKPLFPLTLIPACSPALQTELDKHSGGSVPFPVVVHSGRPSAWKTWAKQCGIQLPEASSIIRLDSMSAVVQAAERGLGVALVPLQLTQAAFKQGRLVQLFKHGLVTSDAYFIAHRKESQLRPDVLSFRRWVIETFATDS